ncbi:MAG: LD-carboxypeptidase [Ferruginibacter sp.]
MNRKNFLTAIAPVAGVITDIIKNTNLNNPATVLTIPPYLKKEAVIGITCPAGYITLAEIQPAISKLKEWGFNIRIGNTVGKKDFTFGGTDQERLDDFQQMLDDKNIDAILCARGGYGAVRIIDKLNFRQFASRPKWIIGFSDITVLHSHLNRNYGIASLHAKMCNSFPDNWSQAEPVQKETIESIQKCLAGEIMTYPIVPNTKNKTGVATGVLIGGNLKTIESLAGSSSDLISTGKILFVEDTGEYLYSIDRMFWNLKRTGKLARLQGLIIGGFKIKKDDEGEEFGKTLEEIVLEKVAEYNYPVCFDFPVGHQKNNFALKCGVTHRLTVEIKECLLTETT